MGTTTPTDEDHASAYEALVEFLYLAPVGIIKFAPDGAIEMANPTAAQLLMPLAPSGDMSNLFDLLSELAPDLREHVGRFDEPAGQIFDQLELRVPKTGTALMLDINKINGRTLMAAVQNITDLTEAKRQVAKATEAQRLFASVFMHINVSVLVIRSDGFVLTTNAAFQQLTGYAANGLVGLHIDALLPPECTGAARAARSQQMLDGTTYQVEMEIFAKDKSRLRVLLNSAILQEPNARQLRVITLVSNVPMARQQGTAPQPTPTVEQVRVVDLASFSRAIGADWEFISSRAMTLAEEAIKPLLRQEDVLKRGKGTSFVIWFADGDHVRNTAIVARATQAIRRMFNAEFGSKIAERVRGAEAA